MIVFLPTLTNTLKDRDRETASTQSPVGTLLHLQQQPSKRNSIRVSTDLYLSALSRLSTLRLHEVSTGTDRGSLHITSEAARPPTPMFFLFMQSALTRRKTEAMVHHFDAGPCTHFVVLAASGALLLPSTSAASLDMMTVLSTTASPSIISTGTFL